MRKDDCRVYLSSLAYLLIVAIFLPGSGLPLLRSRLSNSPIPGTSQQHTFSQSGC